MLDIDLKRLKPPFLVHSDTFSTFIFIKDEYRMSRIKPDPCSLHLSYLSKLFGADNLIFPSFNYDFPKTKVFDLQKTPSQVGHLTNFILNSKLYLRTKTPIFSFLTNIAELCIAHSSPFSKGSLFDFIYENDGCIVFYGTEINSCTYLHFVEDQYGPPIYRYDKTFSGTLLDNDITRMVNVEFHVRPMGYNLDYDWNYLYHVLDHNKVIHRYSPNFFVVRARDISTLWGELYTKSPFDLLDDKCRNVIAEKVDTLGRRIRLADCEVTC